MNMIQHTSENNIPAGMFFDGVTFLPDDPVVAMAYVPFQIDKSMYDDDKALKVGTLFKDLNKPFLRGAYK